MGMAQTSALASFGNLSLVGSGMEGVRSRKPIAQMSSTPNHQTAEKAAYPILVPVQGTQEI